MPTLAPEAPGHDSVAETITHSADAFRDRVEECVTQTERAVRQDPMRAMLIAAAAGWFFRRLHIAGLLSVVVRIAISSAVPALIAWGTREVFRTAPPVEPVPAKVSRRTKSARRSKPAMA